MWGLIGRFTNYLVKGNEDSRHIRAVNHEGNEINLRILARYPDEMDDWVIYLGECVFMILFGTVVDPRTIVVGQEPSPFVFDRLYEAYSDVRRGLPSPLAPGLNSTWPLLQSVERRKHSNCCNPECNRAWVNACQLGASAFYTLDDGTGYEFSIFQPCWQYMNKYGQRRPAWMEEGRLNQAVNQQHTDSYRRITYRLYIYIGWIYATRGAISYLGASYN